MSIYKYSCIKRDSLLLPIQMKLSEKPKTFCGMFLAFSEFTLSLEHFEIKMSLLA